MWKYCKRSGSSLIKNFSVIVFINCANNFETSEIATQRWSLEKVFWKQAANLQENTPSEEWFQQRCKATLLKSHFGMGVLL